MLCICPKFGGCHIYCLISSLKEARSQEFRRDVVQQAGEPQLDYEYWPLGIRVQPSDKLLGYCPKSVTSLRTPGILQIDRHARQPPSNGFDIVSAGEVEHRCFAPHDAKTLAEPVDRILHGVGNF